jgi:signal transduction histidine kinase
MIPLPGRTIRLRLTLLYGALFLACGAVLLTITYVLVARRYRGDFFVTAGKQGLAVSIGSSTNPVIGTVTTVKGVPDPTAVSTPEEVLAQAHAQTNAALHQLLIQSGIALTIMAVISIWLGWLVAGRVLQPLRTIANAARDISASNLHRRLALEGPDDELRQLGNTFDGLLERLEASFDAQRQFVASASHELRTPLTFERTLLEVALADPEASVESLRETCAQLLASGEQQERLIEALLTLSRSQRGLDRHEPVDLAAITAERLAATGHDGLEIDAKLQPAGTTGDQRLVERLVANLVENAIKHNVPNGTVTVTTETRESRALLTVENTGSPIEPPELDRLFQPFQRLRAERTGTPNGTGLGLSIVYAIATAHDASITVRSRPAGGLYLQISFPAQTPER